jgi:CubicO group peptidase (beta-lactamase class C family)
VSGQPLDRFLDERILKPLGMRDTAFYAEPSKHARIAEAFKSSLERPRRPIR